MNILKYIKKDMCYQCGTCELVCPVDAIKVKLDKNKGLLHPFVDEEKCIKCKKCLKACPISTVNPPNKEKGFKKNYITKSNDTKIYDNSPSGGTVTTIVKYLFDNNLITKAVGIKSINGNSMGVSASTFNEFLELGGSKYQPATPIPALKDLNKDDKIAFIGLPCHMKGISSLIKNNIIKENQIVLKVGLFCTIGRGQNGVEYILDKYKLERGEIVFRQGEHPQDMLVDNKTVCTCGEFLGFNDYLSYPKGCYVCNDLFNVDADISVGDPWGMNLGKCGATIANNTKGIKVLENCINEEYLKEIKVISKQEMIQTQRDSYDFKINYFEQRMTLIIKLLKKLNIEYVGSIDKFNNFDKKICNKLLLLNSNIFNNKIGYKLRKLIPNRLIINLYRNKIILRGLHKKTNNKNNS